MQKVSKVLMGLLILTVSVMSNAKQPVVEWAPFVTVEGTSNQALIAAASKVNAEFLSIQPGFIKRELVKKSDSDSEYADIVYWATQENALAAGAKVETCVVCAEYFKFMDMGASENAGAGFSYYSILKEW